MGRFLSVMGWCERCSTTETCTSAAVICENLDYKFQIPSPEIAQHIFFEIFDVMRLHQLHQNIPRNLICNINNSMVHHIEESEAFCWCGTVAGEHWTGSPNKSIDQIGQNCPKNVRKLCFQPIQTISGHFQTIFGPFFGHFVDIALFWAVQRFARCKCSTLSATVRTGPTITSPKARQGRKGL